MLVFVQREMLVFVQGDLSPMPAPNEKLAESLAVLKYLQKGGRRVFRSGDLSRTHRVRLVQNGFLQEVIKRLAYLVQSKRARVTARPGMPHSGNSACAIAIHANKGKDSNSHFHAAPQSA
jgi:hypothetical protein